MSIEGVFLFGSSIILGELLLRRHKRKCTDLDAIDRSAYGTLVLQGDKLTIPSSTSEGSNQPCELFVCNDSGENCVLIWIDLNGNLSSSYRLINGGSIKDGSVSNRHLEYTYAFHSFVVLKESADAYPPKLADIVPQVGAAHELLLLKLQLNISFICLFDCRR